jgi:hypothetical protein
VKVQTVIFKWEDARGVMVPLPRFGNVCRRQYVDGEEYPLDVHMERSTASHNQYFAALTELYNSLPESVSIITVEDVSMPRWPTSEHFRKWCLIKTGWYVEKNFACASAGHARNLAAFVRKVDEHAVITLRQDVVSVFEAKSQSRAAMGKEKFEASKRDVIDLATSLVGVTKTEAMRAASKPAT